MQVAPLIKHQESESLKLVWSRCWHKYLDNLGQSRRGGGEIVCSPRYLYVTCGRWEFFFAWCRRPSFQKEGSRVHGTRDVGWQCNGWKGDIRRKSSGEDIYSFTECHLRSWNESPEILFNLMTSGRWSCVRGRKQIIIIFKLDELWFDWSR